MTLTGLLREVSRAVTAGGLLWVCVPPVDEPGEATGPSPTPSAGPPPGHPEKLRPDVPPNAVERLLQRQLDGHRGDLATGGPSGT